MRLGAMKQRRDGDATDRHGGNHRQFRPPAQKFNAGLGLGLFGSGRKESAEGDIIRARFRGLNGEVPAFVTGDTHDAGRAHRRAGLGIRRVFLTDMDAIAAQLCS